MSEESQGTTRREFVATAAGVGALATFGFNRMAQAEDQSEVITQTVTFSIKEGQEEAAVEALQQLTQAVKENEPGVLAYIAHRSQKEPSKILFFEVYANQAALSGHSGQPHMRAMFPKFPLLFEGGMNIEKFDRVGGYTRES